MKPTQPPPELWGGIEATVNRVGEIYFDQLERSGHAARLDDLDLIAALGVRTLRYPILWERVAPDGPETADWRWPDERLAKLRDLGVNPIVGLVHHGSGPRHTSLVDPDFPEKLAAYARTVAERYPFVDAFTPVNEPLTTARFSGAYGHWYPHSRDELTFARTLLNQLKGVVLAMRAIREVTPGARLIQTDDLGKTHSTPKLAYQAGFENERRWTSWDLLSGRLTPGTRMWHHLRWAGISEEELAWFEENPCVPDVIGVNYYLTSERMLDEHGQRYPFNTHGGNGRDRYVDVEAVRARSQGIEGPGQLLLEAWQRYGLPLAVTEAHLSSTREEQLRWLMEVWHGIKAAQGAGADVRAMTVWSLLGAFNWNSLVTMDTGHYEPGAFDLRAPLPRSTALTWLMQELAAGREPQHPVLNEPGWWRRPATRLVHQPVRSIQRRGPLALTLKKFSMHLSPSSRRRTTAPLLITGQTGTLGRTFARLCDQRGVAFHTTTRGQVDIADRQSVDAALDALRPWAVVNTAGYVRVDQAESEPESCMRENTEGAATLAAACAARGLPFLTFSSDLVFDGAKGEPYVESDVVNPLNVYGRSKAVAEERVLAAHPQALVVRTSAFFGPWDEHNFVTIALNRLAAGKTFVAVDDETVSPTYVPDLVHTSLDLLLDGEKGVWHLANPGTVTWLELAERAATLAGIDTTCLEGRSGASFGLAAVRPSYSALTSERGSLLVSLDEALARYLQDRRVAGLKWQRAKPVRRTTRSARTKRGAA